MKIFSAQLKGTTTVAEGANVSLTGSFSGSIAGIDINSTNTFTSSTTARLNSIETISASNLNRIASLETISASTISRLNSIETISASNVARISSLETHSASVDNTNTTQNSRLTSLENKTGSLASTGSNTFIGTQTITGSVYISQNLIVQGSSSLQNITASAVDIGTNKIILNVNNPAIRYAGISVYDSGSTNGTGSLFWDSVNNYWLYEHPEDSGAPYNSAILISGPKNTGSLGEESGLVTNYIVKSIGSDHISSSAIYDDGTTIALKSNTEVTGSLKVNSSGKFSSQLNVNTLLNILKTDDSTVGAQLAYDSNANQLYLWTSISSGYFSIYTNSTERLTVTSGGKVGIGNNSPVRKVDIVSTGEQLRLSYDAGGTTYTDFRSDSAGGLLVNTSGGYIIHYIGGSEKTRLTSGGNVGIGTNDPQSRLHTYASNDRAAIRIQNAAAAKVWEILPAVNGVANSGLSIFNATDATTPLHITDGGNIGIGITNPKEALEITGLYGNIRIYGRSGVSNNTISSNQYYNGSAWVHDNTSYGSCYMTLSAQYGAIVFATTGNTSGDATERMRITSDGNIGIGTTNPGYNLDIQGAEAKLQLKNNSTGGGTYVIASTYNSWSAGGGKFVITTDGGTNGIKFTIDSSGYVGIGTYGPTAALHTQVNSSTWTSKIINTNTSTNNAGLLVKAGVNSGNEIILGQKADGTNVFLVDASGNVGINTTSPSAKLDIKASGDGDMIVGRYSGGSAKLFYVYQSSADGYLELRTGANDIITKLSGYSGTQAYMNTKLTVGGTGSYTAASLNVEGPVRANRSIYNWYQSGTNAWDGYQYLHLKTNMWAGGSPNGNSDYTMSLFIGRLYSYSSAYIREGSIGFHNWSGSIYNIVTTGNFWSTAYTSSDGYVVLVVALGGGTYFGVTIDWHQAYGYPFRDKIPTSISPSNSSSGVY